MSIKNQPEETVEIIQNRLYWTTEDKRSQPNTFVFNSDRDFKYLPFNNDIGPVDINLIYKYCKKLENILSDPSQSSKKIYHMTCHYPSRKINAALLMGSFCLIVLKKSVAQVTSFFSFISLKFRDASEGPCFFYLTLHDCFCALEQAIKRNWFNYFTFDSNNYEFYAKVENGDLNWIIPKLFVAFCSPAEEGVRRRGRLSAEKYCGILKKMNVRTVIRLNKPKYSACKFAVKGINHYDLQFKDGSIPPIDLVNRFIEICISEPGAIAVHCKAGLGRTGTLIGCYAIKNFKFPAAAFIAWCRLCRPGSVLGPQQQFLLDFEEAVKNKKKLVLNTVSTDSLKASVGDSHQGRKLVAAKSRYSTLTSRTRKLSTSRCTPDSEKRSFDEDSAEVLNEDEEETEEERKTEVKSKFILEFRKILGKFSKVEKGGTLERMSYRDN